MTEFQLSEAKRVQEKHVLFNMGNNPVLTLDDALTGLRDFVDAQDRKAMALLQKHEDWEGELIGDARCWAPLGMAPLPRFTQQLWDKFMEMQSERNLILRPDVLFPKDNNSR